MQYPFVPYPFRPRSHPARLPPESTPGETAESVVIVGGGPVGFATALGLANHGVRSIVLEADEGVCIGSRAICISRRSLEIIDQLGALPAFLAKGLPWSGGRSFYRNEPVLHFTMPHDDTQRLPPMINIEQFYIEQFLLDACEARADLIDIRWQSRATAIEPGTDGVRLMVRTPLGQYPLRAAWLVGCDGARSAVREAAGLKLDGTSYEGRYIIADIFCPTHRPVERLAWFDPPSNPGST
ncbi:MAG: FAD-dependent monooxygenase, partial [Proteobacteria bacterium]|nr:FAD-dependent monooxygenase [Pseudomonadota bacterium]